MIGRIDHAELCVSDCVVVDTADSTHTVKRPPDRLYPGATAEHQAYVAAAVQGSESTVCDRVPSQPCGIGFVEEFVKSQDGKPYVWGGGRMKWDEPAPQPWPVVRPLIRLFRKIGLR